MSMISMRAVPLGPMMEKLSLSTERYGKGRRFYVQTLDDLALLPDVQEKLVREIVPKEFIRSKEVIIVLSSLNLSLFTRSFLRSLRFLKRELDL